MKLCFIFNEKKSFQLKLDVVFEQIGYDDL